MKRLHLIVSGLVQGVGYRYSAQKKAVQLQLAGYVQNLPDGSVEIEVQGTPEAIDRFIQWAHQGPPRSEVRSVKQNELSAASEEGDFLIR